MSELKRALGFFDVMNLVIGTIVGADIYIAASFGAGLLGPASLLAWLLAGIMAIIIALCFAECSSIIPRVGGPYAYAKEAFGNFWGFLVGWALLIAEWSAIAVFPLVFVAYLSYFFPNLSVLAQTMIKILFVLFLTAVNLFGVKQAGKANDILTILKIAPLILFTLVGIVYFFINPSVLMSNFIPFAPLGFQGIGSAIVLIFWAYIGFELVTVPSSEIKNPKRNIPLAIIVGMALIILFYFITNFVVLGAVPWASLSNSTAPLALAGFAIMGSVGALLLTIGALFSISGSDEAGILSSARIPYAMAGDGLLPHFFAKVHPKYGTPYMALIIQNVITLFAAIFGTINQLIVLSVFAILFCYLVTCLSVFPLRKKFEGGINLPSAVPIVGVIICLFIMSQTAPTQIIVGIILMAIGVPIYVYYSPQKEIKRVKDELEACVGYCEKCAETCPKRVHRQEIFLANFLRLVRKLVRSKL